MRLVKQRKKNDCGVACVAMVAGVSYDRALTQLFNDAAGRRKFYTKTNDLVWALRWLGTDNAGRLARLPADPARRRERLRQLASPAIVKTRNFSNGNWHWLVYDPKSDLFYDPKSGPQRHARVSAVLKPR